VQEAGFTQNGSFNLNCTAEDVRELDERRTRRLSGEAKTYTWQQAKGIITGKNSLDE
jgi:hypothetical protein